MVGKTNVAGARLRSVIAVTYPSGSVCTCSNGTKTLKARDTSGRALFNVTLGEWTVSCTDGSRTKSAQVSITAEGQFESVTLSYELYIFKSGSGFVNGFSKSGVGTVTDDVYSQPSGSQPRVTIVPDVDLSPYSQVIVDGKGLNYSGYGHLTYLQVKSDDTVLAQVLIDAGRQERSIDISKINQVATLYLTGNTSGWEIYNLLLK